MSDPTRPEDPKPVRKHSHARRKLLKSLAVGAGAAAAATVVPTKWVKPVVDTISVPLHAQGTPVATMQCQLDIAGTIYTEGSHDVPTNVDGGTDIDNICVEIDPLAVGQNVAMEIVRLGDSDALYSNSDQIVPTNDLGQSEFTSSEITLDDSSTEDVTSGFTATFSSAGFPDCVITLTFTPPPP